MDKLKNFILDWLEGFYQALMGSALVTVNLLLYFGLWLAMFSRSQVSYTVEQLQG